MADKFLWIQRPHSIVLFQVNGIWGTGDKRMNQNFDGLPGVEKVILIWGLSNQENR